MLAEGREEAVDIANTGEADCRQNQIVRVLEDDPSQRVLALLAESHLRVPHSALRHPTNLSGELAEPCTRPVIHTGIGGR